MTGIMTQIFYLFPDASSYDVILFLNLVQNGHNYKSRGVTVGQFRSKAPKIASTWM